MTIHTIFGSTRERETKKHPSTPSTPTYDNNVVVSNEVGLHSTLTYDDNVVNDEVGLPLTPSTPLYDDNVVNEEVGLQLVVESILALISEAQLALATIEDLAAPQSALSKLIVVLKSFHSGASKLIVCSSEISLNFCEDCRIFHEGEWEIKVDGE